MESECCRWRAEKKIHSRLNQKRNQMRQLKFTRRKIKLLFTHVDIDGALSPEYEEKAAVEPLYFTRTRVMEFSDT